MGINQTPGGYDKYVRNDDPDGTSVVESREEKDLLKQPSKQPFGQAKYAVRGMGPSIYQDKSRYTADDEAACKVSDTGKPMPGAYEESQGI